eukprot:7990782-Pyramimonas_sp.AAC.1
MGSSTEAPNGAARMRRTRLIWYSHPPSAAFRGLIGSFTDGPCATARMRSPSRPAQRFVAS